MSGVNISVFTKSKPEQRLLESFVSEHQEFWLEGRLDGEGIYPGRYSCVVRLRRKGESDKERSAHVYKVKMAFEDEDLPPGVAQFVPAPCWMLEIGHVYNDELAWDDCIQLARYVATWGHGVTYTGEAGLELPDGRRPHTEVRPRRSPRDVLTLEWVAYFPKLTPESMGEYLRTVEENFPPAWPRRFGETEPLQGQLSPGEHHPFVKLWQEISDSDDVLKLLEFKMSAPALAGHITFPGKSNREPDEEPSHYMNRALKQTENISIITLQLDGGAVSGNPDQLESAVKLFTAVSCRLGCFYGRGFYDQGIDDNSGLGRMGNYPHRTGHAWTGLPPIPMWLNWFGKPYKDLVLSSIKSSNPEEIGDGVFIRMGSKPATLREMQDRGLVLPSQLLPTKPKANPPEAEVMAALSKLEAMLDAKTRERSPPPQNWSPPVWERGPAGLIPDLAM